MVPPEHLRLLGDIAVTFGLIHYQLMTVAQLVIGIDEAWEQAITAELSLSQLRSVTLSVYRAKFGEDPNFAELRALMSRLELLEQRRNSITHSLWTVTDDMTQTSRLKVGAKEKRGLKHVFEHVSESKLKEDVALFHKLSSDLSEFEINVCLYLPD